MNIGTIANENALTEQENENLERNITDGEIEQSFTPDEFAELNDVFIEDEVESIENSENSNDEIDGCINEVNDSDLSSEDEEFDEIMQLREWAIKSNIPHIKLDSQLQILRRRLLPELPATAKSFLKTNSAEYNITKFNHDNGCNVGEFVYFGIAKHLERTVNPELHENEILHLKINIDELPLYNSSLQQFWPILRQLHFEPEVYKPFPIAVYAGKEKPNDLIMYFDSFIVEINELLLKGRWEII